MTQLPPSAWNVQAALRCELGAIANSTPHAILATTYPELVRMTQGAPVEVS
jgi:hypothetical protein